MESNYRRSVCYKKPTNDPRWSIIFQPEGTPLQADVDYVHPRPDWLAELAKLFANASDAKLSAYMAQVSKIYKDHPQVKDWLNLPRGMSRVADYFLYQIITGMGQKVKQGKGTKQKLVPQTKRTYAQWLSKVQNVYFSRDPKWVRIFHRPRSEAPAGWKPTDPQTDPIPFKVPTGKGRASRTASAASDASFEDLRERPPRSPSTSTYRPPRSGSEESDTSEVGDHHAPVSGRAPLRPDVVAELKKDAKRYGPSPRPSRRSLTRSPSPRRMRSKSKGKKPPKKAPKKSKSRSRSRSEISIHEDSDTTPESTPEPTPKSTPRPSPARDEEPWQRLLRKINNRDVERPKKNWFPTDEDEARFYEDYATESMPEDDLVFIVTMVWQQMDQNPTPKGGHEERETQIKKLLEDCSDIQEEMEAKINEPSTKTWRREIAQRLSHIMFRLKKADKTLLIEDPLIFLEKRNTKESKELNKIVEGYVDNDYLRELIEAGYKEKKRKKAESTMRKNIDKKGQIPSGQDRGDLQNILWQDYLEQIAETFEE